MLVVIVVIDGVAIMAVMTDNKVVEKAISKIAVCCCFVAVVVVICNLDYLL